jgi:MFS family permease
MLTASNSIWLLYFVNAFQSSILYSLIPFVTSDFESHSLLNVIYIVGDAMSAAVFIPLAKILDVWGRAEGYLFMTVCCTLGLILMASCHDLSTFCAAYVSFSAIPFITTTKILTFDFALGVLHNRLLRHHVLR